MALFQSKESEYMSSVFSGLATEIYRHHSTCLCYYNVYEFCRVFLLSGDDFAFASLNKIYYNNTFGCLGPKIENCVVLQHFLQSFPNHRTTRICLAYPCYSSTV